MKHFWIYKGTSNHCNELQLADDCETFIKNRPEGFYDIVSLKDTIEGGIHVIDKESHDIQIMLLEADAKGWKENALAHLKEIQSLKIQLKLQADALENSSRKLSDANERIVEFERIKKDHLEYVKQLRVQLEDACNTRDHGEKSI